MATTWEAPDGFVLTVHDGYQLNNKGFKFRPGVDTALMPDGQMEVAWFDEAEPFVWTKNTGAAHYHPAGQPDPDSLGAEGWSPKITMKPIQAGYVPAVYNLTSLDDPSVGTVEPHDRAGVA